MDLSLLVADVLAKEAAEKKLQKYILIEVVINIMEELKLLLMLCVRDGFSFLAYNYGIEMILKKSLFQ